MTIKKSATTWYLYIIENKYCQLYTGITTDWQRRFEEHCENGLKTAKALKGKGPLKMHLCVSLASHSEALRAEIWVKKQNRLTKTKIINQTTLLPFEHSVVHDSFQSAPPVNN